MRDEILSRGVTRRAVLGGMAGVAALSIAGRVVAAGGEAPAWAQLARDGKLPPLAERATEEADGRDTFRKGRHLWRNAPPRSQGLIRP